MLPSHAVHVIEDPATAAVALHPVRQQILARLAEPDSAAGLARRLGLPRQRLNYHLRQLEAEGLVELVEERKQRNCTERMVRAVARSYVIGPSALGGVAADPASVQDHASSAYLVAVAAEVIRDVAALRDRADRAGKRLATLALRTEVRFASPGAQRAFADELTQAVAGLVTKYHDETTPGGRRVRVVAAAHPVPTPTSPSVKQEPAP
jgi:DNA-binding transcriptional ArsR family regulator